MSADEPVFFVGGQGLSVDQLIAMVDSMTTTHHTTNIRIDVKERADTAVLAADALNQSYKPGTGNTLGTSVYVPTGNPDKKFVRSGSVCPRNGKGY